MLAETMLTFWYHNTLFEQAGLIFIMNRCQNKCVDIYGYLSRSVSRCRKEWFSCRCTPERCVRSRTSPEEGPTRCLCRFSACCCRRWKHWNKLCQNFGGDDWGGGSSLEKGGPKCISRGSHFSFKNAFFQKKF